MAGTILGGVLGFYVMHRVEISYKEKMKERLRQYEMELEKKQQQQQQQMNELEDSAYSVEKCQYSDSGRLESNCVNVRIQLLLELNSNLTVDHDIVESWQCIPGMFHNFARVEKGVC
ncbi:hypothetical protein NL676_003451 [Syzygium grande]|nr:hypothetical protein NL676_003451 [Syzygium grande]